jgi:hypothetical protein
VARGGDWLSLGDYVSTAGYGALFGAVAEIGLGGAFSEKHPGCAILLLTGDVLVLRKEGTRLQVVDLLAEEEDLRATLGRAKLQLEIVSAEELPHRPSTS